MVNMKSKSSRKFAIVFIVVLIGFVVLCAFHVKPVESLESPPTEWSRTYGGTSDDSAEWVIQTKDGGYAVAGYTYSYGAGGVDAWLVKTDSAGHMQWSKPYGGNGGESASSVVQTSDEGYVVAGDARADSAGTSDFWLVKIADEHAQVENGLLTVYVGVALAAVGAATVATIIYVKRFKR